MYRRLLFSLGSLLRFIRLHDNLPNSILPNAILPYANLPNLPFYPMPFYPMPFYPTPTYPMLFDLFVQLSDYKLAVAIRRMT